MIKIAMHLLLVWTVIAIIVEIILLIDIFLDVKRLGFGNLFTYKDLDYFN